MMRTTIAALAVVALAAPEVQAAPIVTNWNLNGQPGDQASVAGTGSSNVTASALARGAGLTGNTGANSINASGWNSQSTDYFSFGFTVAPTYALDLDRLFIGTRSSATGPGTIGLFYSLDSYATALTTFSQAPGANFVNTSVDLSLLANFTGTVEFRLIQVGGAAANGGATGTAGTFRVSNYFNPADTGGVSFTGTLIPPSAPVPLPAAVWLLGSALLGLAGLRRRVA